jgi:tetratricopeptide (TPR) repeat protein/CHAT domain-containing protein
MAFGTVSYHTVAQETHPSGHLAAKLSQSERTRLLQERDRHRAAAVSLADAGKLDDAVRELSAALSIERQVLGELCKDAAETLNALADIYEFQEDWVSARNARRGLLLLHERQPERRDWRVGDARRALAELERQVAMTPEQRQSYRSARQLNASGFGLMTTGQYRAAEAPLLEAIRIRKNLLGQNHPHYAGSLNNLGALYVEMGDYARAESYLRQAMKIWKKAVGEDHPNYAQSLHNLGALYVEMGDYVRAESPLRQAMEIWKKAVGEDHPDYANSLHLLGTLCLETGDHARAESFLRQAAEFRKKARGEDDPDYAISLNKLGSLYLVMGKYARAESHLRHAMEIRKKTVGKDDPAYAESLGNLGSLYNAIGDYAQAEPLLRQAVEITKRAVGENHPAYSDALNELGVLYHAKGDYAQAEPLLRQALEISKKAVSADRYARSLLNLGGLYRDMGDFARAESPLRQTVEMLRKVVGETHPKYAKALINLGVLYHAKGDYDQAEPLHRQALEIMKKSVGEDHPDYALSLNDLGVLYWAMGDTGRAEPLLREALERETDFYNATVSALDERRRIKLLESLRIHLDNYLGVARQRGAGPEALYRRVLDFKGTSGARQAQDRFIRDRPELRPVLGELTAIRAQLAQLAFTAPTPAQQDAWREHIGALRQRKEGLEAQLASRSAAYRAGKQLERIGPEEVAAALPPRTALIDLIVHRHSVAPPGRRGEFKQELSLLAFVVQHDRPIVCVVLGDEKPIVDAVVTWVQARAADRSADVQQLASTLGSLVWEPLRRHLGDAQTMLVAPDGALMYFPFAALPGRNPGSYLIEELAVGYVGSGREAASQLIAPGGTPSTGLLAAGAIDFQADPGSAAPAPSGKGSLLSSATEPSGFQPLPGTKAEGELARDLFRRAFPDQPVALLTGSEPTEAEMKKRLDGGHWRAVHLGTHGFFESPARVAALRAARGREQPFVLASKPGKADADPAAFELTPLLNSGVVMAGGGRAPDSARSDPSSGASGREDGILTAEEVQSLDMRGTELVVLSACETGLGEGIYGQGVFGLQRAFLAAGARAVLASLWKVDDAATSVLMEQFYVNLWVKKMPKLEALRQAQLAVLNDPMLVKARRAELAKRGIGETPEKLPAGGILSAPSSRQARSDPSLWAAFVLSGDGR